jgi:hypothetical protein
VNYQLSTGCNQTRHAFGPAQLKLVMSKRDNLVLAAERDLEHFS